MLSAEENARLTQVGPGTPIGELLRRYWHPIAAVGQLDEKPVMPVKLLGEELVLYRDRSGTLGLIDRYCPHRRANMILGIPEEEGLRCPYHGWRFNETGKCLEQPAEPRPFCDRVKMTSYPVREACGAVWAYLGPAPVPELPMWDLMTWENADHEIGFVHIPCNWLQSMENCADTMHFPVLHGNFHDYVLERLGRPDLKKRLWRPGDPEEDRMIGINEHDYEVNDRGILIRYTQANKTKDDPDWRIGRQVAFPTVERAVNDLEIRVPIDDTHMMYFCVRAHWLPPGEKSKQDKTKIPYFEVPYALDKNNNIDWSVLDGNGMQDNVVWGSMGPVVDRSKEMLGDSDRSILLYRRLLKEQAELVAEGKDPMNVFRDPEQANCIYLAAPEEEDYWEFQQTQQISRNRSFNKYSPIARERVVELLGEDALKGPIY
jgi:5,5'-dehydrodivanillate O-demethylase